MSDDLRQFVEAACEKSPILLFDGVCNFCSAAVQFVIHHDRLGRIRFASLQSVEGQALLQHLGIDSPSLSPSATPTASATPSPSPIAKTEEMNSVVLLRGGVAFTRSDAVLQLVRYLAMPWPLLAVLQVVPSALRDYVYDWIARNRYRWFGYKEVCFLPAPELQSRFLSWKETHRVLYDEEIGGETENATDTTVGR